MATADHGGGAGEVMRSRRAVLVAVGHQLGPTCSRRPWGSPSWRGGDAAAAALARPWTSPTLAAGLVADLVLAGLEPRLLTDRHGGGAGGGDPEGSHCYEIEHGPRGISWRSTAHTLVGDDEV